jgi:sarcosine oxidase
MPSTLHVPHVVLGAGAVGTAAAYALARRGAPVALVDQFAFGHDRGSSHGAVRIIRHSYADGRYARLMLPAYAAWRDLEADAGTTLHVRTGGVSVSPRGCDYVDRVAASLAAIGVPHRAMSGEEWSWRNPGFAVDPRHAVVFEPDAGLLLAVRCLGAMLERARHLGGARTTLLPNTPIRRIDLNADRPTLVGEDLVLTADRLIVAAGSWTGALVPALASRLTPTLQRVFYFRPPDLAPFEVGRLPVFIYKGNAGAWDAFYGTPAILGDGVKVARHGGPAVDPDEERSITEADREVVRRFLAGFLPAVGRAPIVKAETCLYTMAPDEDFIVGPLPGRPAVVVASPCSGHGFKFACLVGRLLADYALDGRPGIDPEGIRLPG